VSPRQKGVPFPDAFSSTLHAGSFSIGWLEIISGAVCLAALLVLTLMLRRTVQGLGMLAASQDFAVTRLMGIKANRVVAVAFALSGLLAGIAGIFILARRGTVEPTMGFTPVLKAFIATVIGGLGSLSGAVFGGFVLAFVEVMLSTFLPDDLAPFRDAFSLLIVIAILYFRPDGLLAPKEELA
jgi:branched-chain amino acid transport system permease protein